MKKLALSGDRKPVRLEDVPFSEAAGQFSPDGRCVAYMSNESGQYEVYVGRFPGPGGKRQVSTSGGSWPRWRRDGQAIFYIDPHGKLMAAAVSSKGDEFQGERAKPLFQVQPVVGMRSPYDVSPDGKRFLVNTLMEQESSAPLTIVVNWTAGLKQ
jgi:hypothetical protein